MASRSHVQKKASDSSPAPHAFLQPRPFAPPPQAAPARTMEDVHRQLEQVRRFKPNLVDIPLSSIESSSLPIQPKLTIGSPKATAEPEAVHEEKCTPTKRLKPLVTPILQKQLEHAQRFGHHLANYRLTPRNVELSPIQTKLTIGAPGDKYEQEADRVAKQVVQRINAPQPITPQLPRPQFHQSVQRETRHDEDDEIQRKPGADQLQRRMSPAEDEIQRKPIMRRSLTEARPAAFELERAISQERGNGQPLTDALRSSMEQAFAANFSRDRGHTDPQLDQLNRSIQARAFTTGQDIFFRQGAYQPESRDGQELVAHGLTQVVQQNNDSGFRGRKEDYENINHRDYKASSRDKKVILDIREERKEEKNGKQEEEIIQCTFESINHLADGVDLMETLNNIIVNDKIKSLEESPSRIGLGWDTTTRDEGYTNTKEKEGRIEVYVSTKHIKNKSRVLATLLHELYLHVYPMIKNIDEGKKGYAKSKKDHARVFDDDLGKGYRDEITRQLVGMINESPTWLEEFKEFLNAVLTDFDNPFIEIEEYCEDTKKYEIEKSQYEVLVEAETFTDMKEQTEVFLTKLGESIDRTAIGLIGLNDEDTRPFTETDVKRLREVVEDEFDFTRKCIEDAEEKYSAY